MRSGNFSQRLTLERQDEFGTLADGSNRMIDDLTVLIGKVQESGLKVNSSMTEIAATSKELVRTMNEVSSVTEQSAVLAVSGQVGISHMEGTMRHVAEAAGSINAKLSVLNEKAGNINQVVITITKVADQTNMLSLNAAIEAEKAGEYGRGFAVVATEIRRLADQTAVATYDIEQTVKEIQSAVAASVMGMDKFSEEVLPSGKCSK
jgi:methyl-accepting chemotaxis protein WspA